MNMIQNKWKQQKQKNFVSLVDLFYGLCLVTLY